MKAAHPMLIDVVDGPGRAHLLVLVLSLARGSIAVAFVGQVVPEI